METYFKLRTILEFGVPALIFLLLIIWGLYATMKGWLKSKLMKRMGYEYKKGLGNNVAYEFQPHWIKGNIKINCREIDSLNYFGVSNYVKNKESK